MIEISHNQARRFIRESLDDETSSRVSTEQWASLQLHLESCPDCRLYAENLTRVQRGLKRSLHQRWDAGHALTASGKGKVVMEDVKIIRGARKIRQKFALYAMAGAFLLFAILLWRGYQIATAPPPTATLAPTEFGATATATPIRFRFHGVVAMDAPGENGASDIYLFNSGFGPEGSSLENLTSSPASDIYPSWSPDGEWLAFLSNRDAPDDRPDKLDVYVMHISGSQLTRLTNDPNVSYDGPISWQIDGGWLGSIGHHWADADRARFVYLVPVNRMLAGRARTVGLTAGALGPVRFSPGDLLIAYRQPAPGGSYELTVFDRSFGRFIPVTRFDRTESGLATGANGQYGWSGDGRRLVYLAEGTDTNQIKSTIPLRGEMLRSYNSVANSVWETVPADDLLTGASFSPIPGTNLIAYLRGQSTDGAGGPCAILHIRDLPGRAESAAALTVPNLCVLKSVSQENWIVQQDPWLIVIAQPLEEGQPGLYAIRILPDLSMVAVERLADFAEMGADEPPAGALPAILTPNWIHARPAGLSLQIDPSAAVTRVFTNNEPVNKIENLQTGRIVYTRQEENGTSQVISINPDGGGKLPLTREGEDAACPAISPDGQTVSILTNRFSRHPALKEVMLIDSSGGNPRQITFSQSVYPYTETGETPNINIYPAFDCPVWSQDGTRLAAILHTGGSTFLVVIPTNGSNETYLRIQPVSAASPPVWINGHEVALVYPGQEIGSSTRIIAINVDNSRDGLPANRTIITAGDWRDVYGMLVGPFFPDGSQSLAFLGAEYSSFEGTILSMHIFGMQLQTELPVATMPTSLLRANIGSNRPFLHSDGQIAFLQRFAYDEVIKTRLMLYNPDTRILSTAAEIADIVFDYAPSPDASWMVYAAETGLYMVNIAEADQGFSTPIFLFEEPVTSVDWQ